jgi:hypothetical protein
LILPRLERLEVRQVKEECNMESIIHLASSYHANLRSVDLELMCTIPMDVTIERLLRCIPHCTHLTLRGRLFGHLFHLMAVPIDRPLLPRLESLQVFLNANWDTLCPPFAAVLNAGFSIPTLRSLHVEMFEEAVDFDQELADRLENLRASGVETKVDWVKNPGDGWASWPQLIFKMIMRILTYAFRNYPHQLPGTVWRISHQHVREVSEL